MTDKTIIEAKLAAARQRHQAATTAVSGLAASIPHLQRDFDLVQAETASIIGTISGTSYGGGRQYGGPVSADTMYRVNETGAPEVFTAGNGQQYMLPTKSGQVTPADQVGGGGLSVVINNAPEGAYSISLQDKQLIINLAAQKGADLAVGRVNESFASNSGSTWNTLKGSSNVRSGGLS